MKKHLPLILTAIGAPLLTTATLALTTPNGVVIFKRSLNIKLTKR